MGSGRSGFYRGKYLKGMGRTPLASNWNNLDFSYNSGHLPPSAAIREYLATQYLSDCGFGNSIVRCEGILFRELPSDLKKFSKLVAKSGNPPPIDCHLQAITYKQGDFIRSSNIIWYLRNMGVPPGIDEHFSIAEFVSLLVEYCHPKVAVKESHLTPDLVARSLVSTIEKTLDSFECYLRAGVYWGSFNNNFTLDGRFVDLELPSFFGGPFLGALLNVDLPQARITGNENLIGGFEMFSVATHFRFFIGSILERLDFLVQFNAFGRPIEREYASALASGIRAALKKSAPWLSSKKNLIDHLSKRILENMPLSPESRKIFRKMTNKMYDRNLGGDPKSVDIEVKRLSLALPRIETYSYYAYSVGEGQKRKYKDKAEKVNRAILEIEKLKDVDEVLERLRRIK
jgi:hypothetical protein